MQGSVGSTFVQLSKITAPLKYVGNMKGFTIMDKFMDGYIKGLIIGGIFALGLAVGVALTKNGLF